MAEYTNELPEGAQVELTVRGELRENGIDSAGEVYLKYTDSNGATRFDYLPVQSGLDSVKVLSRPNPELPTTPGSVVKVTQWGDRLNPPTPWTAVLTGHNTWRFHVDRSIEYPRGVFLESAKQFEVIYDAGAK